MLMNGPLITEAANRERGALLASLEAPFFTDAQRVEVLTLATLSRYPTDEERSRLEPLLSKARQEKQTQRALGDLLWALLNSAEFALNH